MDENTFSLVPKEQEPLSLSGLVDQPTGFDVPLATQRNRAAITALLGGQAAPEAYQGFMGGGDVSEAQKPIIESAVKGDMQGIISVLTDRTIPIEQKQQAIEAIKKSSFLREPSVLLQSKALEAESKGENRYAEEARLTLANSLLEGHIARQKVQGLVNAHTASLNPDADVALSEIAEVALVPFATSRAAQKLSDKLKPNQSWWDRIKNAAAPGEVIKEERDHYQSLPPDKKVIYVSNLKRMVSENSGLILSSENQYSSHLLLEAITGDYSSFDRFLDNAAPWLDAVGLGFVGKLAKGGKKVVAASEVASDVKVSSVAKETFESNRLKKQQEARRKIEEQWAFEPDKATPDTIGTVQKPVDGIPALLGGTGKKALEQEKPTKLAALLRKIEINNTVRVENPASPAKIIQQGNPDMAREIHSTLLKSPDNVFSEAMYGTSKVDALASDTLPQVSVDGRVTTRSFDIERNIRKELSIDPRIAEVLGLRGALELQPSERAAIVSKVQHDFTSAEGLVLNSSMSAFSLEGDKVRITGVYGTPDGGWKFAEDAIEQAILALRSYGVKTDDIQILKKEGLDHVPVSLDSVRGKEGNYLISIKMDADASLTQLKHSEIEKLDVKKNWTDRFAITSWGSQGRLANHIMDNASMLHPSLTGAAVAVNDLAVKADKVLLSIAEEFTKAYTKLDGNSQTKVMQYIKEANYKQIRFDPVALQMAGWTEKELDVVKAWRNYWDGAFYLENSDLVKTLDNQGFQYLHSAYTSLFAKPLTKNTTLAGQKVYNTATDAIVTLTRSEIDDLYTNGGTLARLRRPSLLQGETVEHVVVWNNQNSYLRRLRESDPVLNYREGYYQIQYKAPIFIDEVLEVDDLGNPTKTRTIAVAGDSKEANVFKTRMEQNTGNKYRIRGDNRLFKTGSDEHWDLASASGRIAQRHRGQLLEDASGLNHLGDGSYIINPVDSAVISARSISGRVMGRPMLENAKHRAMVQYGHMFPSDGRGGHLWPNSINEIKQTGNFTTEELRDARTTVGFINYLENGYSNGLDDGFRYFLNYLGGVAGDAGLPALERLANKAASSKHGIGSLHKSFVFYATIAWNPIRQLIIQPHQAIRTFAFNPIGWTNGNIIKLHYGYLNHKAGLAVDNYTKGFIEFLDDSGMLQAVDRQNLVRGTITDAAGSTNKVIGTLGKAAELPRKVGFDLGEMINTVSHAAAVYEQFARNGAKVADKTVRQEMASKTRALSYDMNFAGDMPYNQNTASMFMQFLQVPHKAVLQLFNRRLSPWEKRRLFMADILFWGVPGSVLLSNYLDKNILPEDEKLRVIVLDGLEAFALNNLADYVLGEDSSDIDWSSLSPYEGQGLSKMVYTFLTEGPEKAFMLSPSGGLIYREGSRVRTAFGTLGRFFGYQEDVEEDFTTAKMAMDSLLSISSGWANWIKASAILEEHKRITAGGRLQEEGVDALAAWMQVAGFGGKSTKDLFDMANTANSDLKSYKEDVLKTYRDMVRIYVAESKKEIVDPENALRITNKLMAVYKNQPMAQKIIQEQLKRDLVDPKQQLIGTMLKLIQIPDMADRTDKINRAPIEEEEKETLKELMRQFQGATLSDKE